MCTVESSQLNSGGFSDVQLLTVILPANNEAHVVNETLVELTTALTGSYIPYEIIVVDDGSNDDTYQIASAYAKTRDAVPYSPAVVAYETANHYHAIVTLTSSAAQILSVGSAVEERVTDAVKESIPEAYESHQSKHPGPDALIRCVLLAWDQAMDKLNVNQETASEPETGGLGETLLVEVGSGSKNGNN